MKVHRLNSEQDFVRYRDQIVTYATEISKATTATSLDQQKATALLGIVGGMNYSGSTVVAMEDTTCLGLMIIDIQTTTIEIEQWVTRPGRRGIGKAMLEFIKDMHGCDFIKLMATPLSRDIYLKHMNFGESIGGYVQMRRSGGRWIPEGGAAASSAAAVAPPPPPDSPPPPPPPDSPPPPPPPDSPRIPPAPLSRSRSSSPSSTRRNSLSLPHRSRPGAPAALTSPYNCLPHAPPPPPPPDETS